MENEAQSSVLPIQSLSQTPPVAPPPNNRPKTMLVSILGLVVVAISLLVGIQIGKNQTLTQQSVIPQPTPASSQTLADPTVLPTTSSPAIDPTINWKTYTNTDAKIFFKYPSTLSISDTTQGTGVIIKIIGLEKEILLTVEPTTEHDFFTEKKVSDIFVLNNISWKYLAGDIQYCDGGECGSISNALQTTSQEKRYTIVLGDLKYPDDTLNQILSTFKFTN